MTLKLWRYSHISQDCVLTLLWPLRRGLPEASKLKRTKRTMRYDLSSLHPQRWTADHQTHCGTLNLQWQAKSSFKEASKDLLKKIDGVGLFIWCFILFEMIAFNALCRMQQVWLPYGMLMACYWCRTVRISPWTWAFQWTMASFTLWWPEPTFFTPSCANLLVRVFCRIDLHLGSSHTSSLFTFANSWILFANYQAHTDWRCFAS